MTTEYARALLARQAAQLAETIDEVAAITQDHIIHHRLAEVKAECEWCKREFGEAER